MAATDQDMRPLKEPQRNFIHYMLYDGMERTEAYALANNIAVTESNRKSIRDRATRQFFMPHVNNYYHALEGELREKQIDKSVWGKDISTKVLMRLVSKAEEELYGSAERGIQGKGINLARINAVVLPVKELNAMNGLTETNVNVQGCVVKISGEENLQD